MTQLAAVNGHSNFRTYYEEHDIESVLGRQRPRLKSVLITLISTRTGEVQITLKVRR
jgi:hypothetical protein